MDTTETITNRVMDLVGDTPPWEESIELMGQALRDHVMEVVEHELLSMRSQIMAQIATSIQDSINSSVDSLWTEMNNLKFTVEMLPDVIKAALESVPSVVVQTPKRSVKKTISYGMDGRPVSIEETEVLEKR